MRSFDYFPCLSCWLGPLAVATHSLKLPDYLSSAQDQLDEAVRFCPAAEFSSPKKKKADTWPKWRVGQMLLGLAQWHLKPAGSQG